VEWVTLDESSVTAHLPTDLAEAYQSWLAANPDKAGRLSELTANTVAEFRDNIRTNPVNTLDPDPEKLPQSCVRHAESIIFFQLAMEMGVDLDTEGNQSMTRADIFLRQISFKRFTTTGGDDSDLPSPHYAVPTVPLLRALPGLLLIVLGWLASPADAGWIANPRRASVDTEITVTLAPQHYTNTTTTLFGHLQGVEKALYDQHARFVDVTGDTINGPLTVSNVWMYVTWGAYTNAISYSGFRFNHPGLGNLGYDISSGGYLWRYTYDINTGTKSYQGKVWDGGNDGDGSGLDADTLDGLNSSAFMRENNGQYTTDITVKWLSKLKLEPPTGTPPYLDAYYYSNQPGENGAFGPVLRLHADSVALHVADTNLFIEAGGQLKKVWNEFNDGAGSGLEADTLDGMHGSAFAPSVMASNTLWFSTNSYLTTLGSYTALYFITLAPPATNRITP